MSLRDEHLQQALRHAPDQALAPSRKVRENVLDYAANAIKPKPANWLKRCLNALEAWRVTSWQVTGVGTIASVLLVLVMVREQLPDESIWVKPEVKDIAQNKAEAPAASAPQQDKLKARQDESAREQAVVTAEKETVARADGVHAKAKRNLAIDSAVPDLTPPDLIAQKKLAEKTETASADPELADKKDVAVAAAKAPESVVIASAPQAAAKQVLSKAAPASAPVASGMMVYVEPIAQVLAKEGGETMAKRDIESGNLRILKTEVSECAKPSKHESSADALTNYKVTVIVVCANEDKVTGELLHREVEAYNLTMLQWYQMHKD